MNYGFPFQVGDDGRTRQPTDTEYIRQLIEVTLLTTPKERVNRPQFGAGVSNALFAPQSPETLTALELTVQASLQRLLVDLIVVKSAMVTSEVEVLKVVVQYQVVGTAEEGTATVVISG